MDRLIYVAMVGARQIEAATMVNNHNMANVNTPGFRADLVTAMAETVPGPGYASRVYASGAMDGIDFSSGAVVTTGNDLDVAINGDGWIAVQASDGTEAYTRRGDFRISSFGILETGDGHAVLGNAGPIAIPAAENIEIGGDGTISILPVGQDAAALTVLDRIRLVRPDIDTLRKREDGLLGLPENETAIADAGVRLESGALEKSNVNMVDTLVNMITLSRAYEMQVKMIQNSKEMDESAAGTLRIS